MYDLICQIIFTSILFCGVITPQVMSDQHTIQLIKQSWHVGILIPVDSVAIAHIPLLYKFSEFESVDIGWGDEDFYQNDGINYYYGAKAILVPTSSVLKITGHAASKDAIIKWVEDSREIKITHEAYLRLLNYIEASFDKRNGSYIESSSSAGGAIKFFKSNRSYHLFNTCNTWIATALKDAGLKIDDNNVITTNDLFEEIDELLMK